MFDRILFELKDGIGRLILNRPDVRNAIDIPTLHEIDRVLTDTENDDDVKVLILEGKGKVFCAGADLKGVLESTKDTVAMEQHLRLWHGTLNHLEAYPKVTIAKIHGLALAGGLELSMVCDLAVADEEARLGDQHSNFGLIGGGSGSQRLPRLIGTRRAKELLFLGNWISGKEAERIGLINKAVPADKLDETINEMAARLASKSLVASRTIKDLVDRGMQADLYTALDLEVWACLRHNLTKDATEGITAFIEKRTPVFKGR
ncbi:MAG: enoyl-CoA hydratase/isomerase family protein [Chloroflexota bacterium]|nr:MAG: enoyl-CoA hydratase/isomerase family protein [Chloroflexota bacterium]